MPATTVTRRVNRERLALLGWGRALLMQFAHPLIAAGVTDHSSFKSSRLARLQRLHSTVRAMLSLTFGSEADVRATADHIKSIHDRVHGVLPEAAGPFPAGTPYSAHDPELLRWVHATLLDSVPLVYERFVAPLSVAEKDAYCREAAIVGRLLGIPDALLPQTSRDVETYIRERVASGDLVVTNAGRALAGDILAPPFRFAYWPVTRLTQAVTVGLLDPSLRGQYGLTWTPADERRLARWTTTVRWAHQRTPARLRHWDASRG